MMRFLDEKGNVTVLSVMIMVCLAALVSAITGIATVYVKWTMLNHALDVARETTMSAGFQMMLKSSDDPGQMVADKLATELRSAGIDDSLTVWFVEEPSESLNDNVRAMAYYAQLETSFGDEMPLGAIDIPCSTVASIVPYAAAQVYKPEASKVVATYTFQQGSNSCSTSEKSLSDMPPALEEALARAVELAHTY